MGQTYPPLPAIEGLVLRPERPGQWPLVTQVIMVPWKLQQDAGTLPTEQVMLVPRAIWERLAAHVDSAVLGGEGGQHG